MIYDLMSAEQHHSEHDFCVSLTRLRLIQPSRNTRGHPVSGVGRQRHRDVDRIWDLDRAAIFVEELNADHGQSGQVGPPGLCTCRGKNHRRQLRQEFYRSFYMLKWLNRWWMFYLRLIDWVPCFLLHTQYFTPWWAVNSDIWHSII